MDRRMLQTLMLLQAVGRNNNTTMNPNILMNAMGMDNDDGNNESNRREDGDDYSSN